MKAAGTSTSAATAAAIFRRPSGSSRPMATSAATVNTAAVIEADRVKQVRARNGNGCHPAAGVTAGNAVASGPGPMSVVSFIGVFETVIGIVLAAVRWTGLEALVGPLVLRGIAARDVFDIGVERGHAGLHVR